MDMGLANFDWDSVDTALVGQSEAEAVLKVVTTTTLQAELLPTASKISLSPAPYTPSWDTPAPHLLRIERPPAPTLTLESFLAPSLANWANLAAVSKGAPVDYVLAGVLVAAASAIGNARWASPRHQWEEPPVLWASVIGNPSAGKSPALDAVLKPIRDIERSFRMEKEAELKAWAEEKDLAKLAESAWKELVKSAVKAGSDTPTRPDEMTLSPEPHIPRLVVNDGTIEKLAVILARQPRGTLQVRDEMAGWLQGMARYSGGGSDRPFWLEAYGGRTFTVERLGREPLTVESMSISALGGIQPDRLNSLLLDSDDDGLLARIMPFWPEPAPITTPSAQSDDNFIKTVFGRLYSLEMHQNKDGSHQPFLIPFADAAERALDEFRQEVRTLEVSSEGLLLSFIGKFPGLSVRLALVLALLDWAAGGSDVTNITLQHYNRAKDFVLNYLLPMARRAYADAALPEDDRRALRLVSLIREKGWETFTTREVMRQGVNGLKKGTDLNPILVVLEDGAIIRPVETQPNPNGGRPTKRFSVNPKVFEH